MKSTDDQSEIAPSAGMPSDGVRTVVSLLVFIHLFAVWLAIMTSGESGGSALLRDVKDRPRFLQLYLTQLWLDRGYDYYLMNDQNWDFHLEATIKYADGHSEGPIRFPDPNISSSENRQRYQQLALSVARYIARANDENATVEQADVNAQLKSLLPESIGASLMHAHPGAVAVALKCIYHAGISTNGILSPDAKENDPYGPQFYGTVGNVSIVLDHGRPVPYANSPKGEVSPLRSKGLPAPKSGSTSRPAAPSATRK